MFFKSFLITKFKESTALNAVMSSKSSTKSKKNQTKNTHYKL